MKKIVLATFLFGCLEFCPAQQWNSLSDVSCSASAVYEFIHKDDLLYLTAAIYLVNGEHTSGVLSWDGTNIQNFNQTWPVGPENIAFSGDTLFVAGSFNSIGNVPGTRGVGMLGAEGWVSLGGGCQSITDDPTSCEFWNSKCYIGNRFTSVGGQMANGFASWNGDQWVAEESTWGNFELGPAILSIYNGDLIGAGDFFQSTTGTPLYNVAQFDGTSWLDIHGGVGNDVYGLFVDGDDLYVGGIFSSAQFGEVATPNRVAYYDGENWHGIGAYNEIGNTVRAIVKYRDQIYIGGVITINGVPWQGLAYFDGVHWHQVPGSEDIDARVRCMTVYNDELYIGGDFQHAGGLTVPGLVRYYLHPDSVQWGVPDGITTQVKNVLSVFPNPASDELHIATRDGLEGQIIITDMSGKMLMTENLPPQKKLTIPTISLPDGMVVFSVVRKGIVVEAQKVVVRKQ